MDCLQRWIDDKDRERLRLEPHYAERRTKNLTGVQEDPGRVCAMGGVLIWWIRGTVSESELASRAWKSREV